MATKKTQRVAILVIMIVLVVGTLGSFAVMILAQQEQSKNAAAPRPEVRDPRSVVEGRWSRSRGTGFGGRRADVGGARGAVRIQRPGPRQDRMQGGDPGRRGGLPSPFRASAIFAG